MSVRSLLMVVSLVLSIAIGLVLARGGGAASGGEPQGGGRGGDKIVIGLSLDTLKETRWQTDRDLFVKRAKELGAEVLVQAANSDDSVQMRDVQTLLTSGVDVLVIVPHDGKAMAKAVNLAHEAKVPVVSYDRLIRDSEPDLYLSFDNLRVGELQAQFVIDRLNGRGNIIRIYGAKTDNNAALFKQGQDKVLEPYIKNGQIKVIHEDWTEDWRPENAKRIANAAISANPGVKIDAVLASNDGTAGGAIQALDEEGLAGKVLVTGQDAELVAMQRIVGGTQSMTIYKPIKNLAPRAVEVAVAMAKGKPVIAQSSVHNGAIQVPSVLSDVTVVTRENMEATVIADGFHSKEDIFRGAAQQPLPAAP
jgi:D-xylose transport system substrate-binding protein